MNISLSEMDKRRFGITTAKATLQPDDSPEAMIAWCIEKNVELLIARVPGDSIRLAQDLENAGFFLTDILVYYQNRQIQQAQLTLREPYSWRLATPEDAESVGDLAREIFKNYVGHYHSDQRLDRTDCDLVYSSWATNSCLDKSVADDVFLIVSNKRIVGFLTVKKQSERTGEIILNGVHPDYQYQGIYQQLITLANNWTADQQLQELIVSTQLSNLAVQKVWCRQGFEPYKNFYTFHKWLST